MTRLSTLAPAKVNLTLSVLARRTDGFHELSSLVAFADMGDGLVFDPGGSLDLSVRGPMAAMAGVEDDNLVLKATRALQARVEGLKTGRFELTKHLPAGAGLGGGSADAGAALRLLAQANELELTDARVIEAARATGADVPVCLESKARLMHGIGEALSKPIALPKLDAAILFPGVPVATKDVFGNFTLVAGPRRQSRYIDSEVPPEREPLFKFLSSEANDLELAARLVTPEISKAKDLLEQSGDARLVRMTGSGSAVFALYDNASLAKRSAAKAAKRNPGWWCVQTVLN
jgi:4-diphosphocytidyl-2-C-methyl-D-erythritol kinase